MSLDEREEEDKESSNDTIPFVIAQDLAEQYGDYFSITLNEYGMPVVEVPPYSS